MATTSSILTKEEIRKAKETVSRLLELRDSLGFLETIKDLDGHTDGLAHEAESAVLELADKIYALDGIIGRIENFGK